MERQNQDSNFGCKNLHNILYKKFGFERNFLPFSWRTIFGLKLPFKNCFLTSILSMPKSFYSYCIITKFSIKLSSPKYFSTKYIL